MKMNISKPQLITINVLVSKLNICKDDKAVMVQGFTGGRETSSAKLYSEEAIEMIRHLKRLDPDEKSAEKMRRSIIAMAHELGWEIQGTGKADLKRIEGWCLKQAGKKLNQYTLKELPNLVTGFKRMHYKFLSKI